MTTASELARLNAAIDNTPIIDHHAHPLLKRSHVGQQALLAITTEAAGDALAATQQSLSHVRAVQQLAPMLGCLPTWDAVARGLAAQRATRASHDAWVRRCLGGLETVLVDDGLHVGGEAEPCAWHDQFTRSRCRRIVRIEVVAEALLAQLCASASEQLEDFVDAFRREIRRAVADPDVAGFKSIICYRGGLDVPAKGDEALDYTAARRAFHAIIDDHVSGRRLFEGRSRRLESLPLNHLVLHLTAEQILLDDDGISGGRPRKPLQFHTGLGDSDIRLSKASAAHLQAFIRDYPGLPIVLLHASWPWTREAAYLATVYANIYLDVGEVFPMLARHGQEQVLRQSLELCPWSKILWSTDGHWLPETYVLATTQVRSVLKTVLGELVQAQQLSEAQAVQLVQDVLFSNAQKLYNLGDLATVLPRYAELSPPTTTSTIPSATALHKLRALGTRYLRVYWHDYTSSARCRVLPMGHVERTLGRGRPVAVSLTQGSLGLLRTDALIAAAGPSGVYALRPDWASLRPGPAPGHASCYGWFTSPSPSSPEEQTPLCPRTLLRRVVDDAAALGLTFLLGFEIEFVVLGRSRNGTYVPLPHSDGHAWSSARALAEWGSSSSNSSSSSFLRAADEALAQLEAAGVEVEQFHAESAPGQFEVVLGPLEPLAACDALLHARQVVEAAAARHGFRVTLHPKPMAGACGTASHAHISVSSSSEEEEKPVYESFYAGILGHLRAVAALAYASPASYERAVDHAWAGGRWAAWGTQNREVPLRKVDGAHWEVKTLDGLANPYFAVAALLAAGTDGVRRRVPLVLGDCTEDPALLSDARRAELNICQMLPANLEEALRALAGDETLVKLLGPEFVRRYIDVKNAELALLNPMSAEQRRQWIMERY
ncbi:hypothetical protein F4775DRAFT_603969 [Biscogniauxia sp. FL1348]|nr:hypothetical protein F4775DRAFT_603969 [Biscogniauxia sp. FL1348]